MEKTWNTKELQEDFEVIGFQAPFVVVVRKSDKVKGSLQFDHHPRVYYSFSCVCCSGGKHWSEEDIAAYELENSQD
jgi:hypothetical protein